MSPSDEQQESLSRMTAILAGNRKASILARSLWEFFDFHLYCVVSEDDGEANRYRIEGIADPRVVDDVRVLISLRRNQRLEEGLVHELLHANLIPSGYPRFWFPPLEDDKFRLAGGIINIADHFVMRPTYLSFGYSEDRFLGPTRPLTNRESRVIADVEQMGAALFTPAGYLTQVSAYLHSHNINFEPIHPGDAIALRSLTERSSFDYFS